MHKKIFWVIVESTLECSDGNLNAQEQLLKEHLSRLTDEQLRTFQLITEELIGNLMFESFLAAVFIIQKNIAPDSIIAFAGWVIAQGEQTYKNVMKDPDYLHDILQFKSDNFKTQLNIDLLAAEINRDLFSNSIQHDKYFMESSSENQMLKTLIKQKNKTQLEQWLLRKVPKLTEAFFI